MTTLSTTTFDYALKVRYSPEVVRWMSYKDNPFYARVKKETDFNGKNFTFACQYSSGGNASATFSDAQDYATPAKGEDFVLTRKKLYAVARIDTETVLASEGNSGALLMAMQDEVDKAFYKVIRSDAVAMFGDGSGKIGSVDGTNGTLTGTTLTLENADDVTNFEVGQKVIFADTITSAARDSGEALTVSKINRDAGTMTMSAALTTIASIADGDLIFPLGDYAAAGSSSRHLAGLAAWLPATAPSSGESFYGVDRSSDVVALAGHRLSGTGKSADEALYDVAVRIARDGGRPNTAYVSYDNFGDLNTLLGTKVQYVQHKVADIAFDGIRIRGPKGPIDVYPDQNCPSGYGYVLTMDTWRYKTLGPAPRFITLGGKEKISTISDEDGIEIRVGRYGNLYCLMPGHNGLTTL